MLDRTPGQSRPLSPNMQNYRPQLTSVLSIGYRLSSIILSLYAVGLVAWLVAAAAGPVAYSKAYDVAISGAGQVLLAGGTFAFFWHLCGGIRHLLWDAGYGFELRTIYWSGWLVVAGASSLTLLAWSISLTMAYQNG